VLILDPWFYLLAIPAFLLTGISKGGFASGGGNAAVPLMSLAIPAPQAAAIALPVLCAMDIAGLRAWWRAWDGALLRHLLPGAMLGVLAGWLIFGLLTDRAVKLIVGLIAFAFLANSLLRRNPAPALPSRIKGWFWAAVSGLTSFVAHAGGPPLAFYLYPLRLDRARLAATTVAFFAAVNAAKLLPYALLGNFSAENLLTAAILLPLAPVGIRLGVWLQRRVDDAAFYRIIHVLLFVTGVKLVSEGLGG
jgi:uncharacterized membrane protein YfcA